MSDLSAFSGKYHRTTEPSSGVLLLEFNRYVSTTEPDSGIMLTNLFRAPVNAFHDEYVLPILH